MLVTDEDEDNTDTSRSSNNIDIILLLKETIQSSQLAEPLWTYLEHTSGISVRELIANSKKKKKKAQAGNQSSNILPKILASKEKKPAPMETVTLNEKRHKDNGPHVQ